ncbi:MAG: addiction module protein [Deltaproteobacteria bacterium]|nr:addiction module protein [Deltaproteobacteria bacterium]
MVQNCRECVEVYNSAMSVNFPLNDMTQQEKLAAMELFWEELTRSPDSFESPEWHRDALEERRHKIAEGKVISPIGRPLNQRSAPRFGEN